MTQNTNRDSIKASKSLLDIAETLSDNEITILDNWEKRMEQENKKASELIAHSRRTFYNSITNFLDYLVARLKEKNITLAEISKKHGQNRWQYGYDLKEIVKEWAILQEVLIEQVNNCYDSSSNNFLIIAEAKKNVFKSIQTGISTSVVTYYEMQKREAVAQVEDLKQTLEKSNKNPASALELRGTSHDLKGAIFVLNTGFDLLKDEELDGKAKKIVRRLSAATKSVDGLLQDLLDLLRLEADQEELRITEFNLSEFLESFCKSMQPLAKSENLELKMKGQKDFPIKSDREKLGRIVQNLVLNALKYTQKGHVKVEWNTISEKHWVLRVSDTGPGISRTTAASLSISSDSTIESHPTISANSELVQRQGEGIGLLVVNKLCKLLDAIIKIETEADEGTTYEISFFCDSIE